MIEFVIQFASSSPPGGKENVCPPRAQPENAIKEAIDGAAMEEGGPSARSDGGPAKVRNGGNNLNSRKGWDVDIYSKDGEGKGILGREKGKMA